VETRDWSTAWREGLGPVSISPRLALRPSFASYDPEPGQHVLLVDPGQAFGTGHHASTRLALALLDRALAARPGARVLDVGTGSGILALAAAALGAREAVGFDVDAVAVREARANAESNGVGDRVRLFAGTVDALGEQQFDLVVANLLRRELLPLASAIAAHLVRGGVAVLSGLLEEERAAIEASLSSVGLIVAEERSERDGGERWVGLLATRGEPA
jgi:ribosomal protein L11 methyltransferase